MEQLTFLRNGTHLPSDACFLFLFLFNFFILGFHSIRMGKNEAYYTVIVFVSMLRGLAFYSELICSKFMYSHVHE